MLYAYIEYRPPRGRDPRVKLTQEMKWGRESWTIGRRLGDIRYQLLRMRKDGPSVPNIIGNVYDARVVPPEAAEVIRGKQAAILQLQQELRSFLGEGFRTWPIVREPDCTSVVPGTSKAEAAQKLKGERTLSSDEASREKQVIGDVNRALGETFLGRDK